MRTLFIVAGSLMATGLFIFLVVMGVLKWDFSKLSTVKYETNNYNVDEPYSSISIKSDSANIEILPTDRTETEVVLYEKTNLKHTVSVKDDTLLIEISDTRKWYEYVEIGFSSPKLTLYLPEREYAALSINESTGDVKIDSAFTFDTVDMSLSTGSVACYASAKRGINIAASTGDVCVSGISAGSLSVSLSTGDMNISDVNISGDIHTKLTTGACYVKNARCIGLSSEGTTGSVTLEGVIASEKISVVRSTGDVTFKNSDGAEIFAKTTTGSVKGSILSDKVFLYQTSTGDVEIPKTTSGGKCELITTTGDIRITVEG